MTQLGELGEKENAVYQLLVQRAECDVEIWALYSALVPEAVAKDVSSTAMQQRVGAVVSRLNRKLKSDGWVISTGHARRSYRLRPL